MPMDRMTFTVPHILKVQAQAHREVNWSAVVAKAIQDRLSLMDKLEAFARKSSLTQQDVDEIAASIDRRLAKKYREKFVPSSSTQTAS